MNQNKISIIVLTHDRKRLLEDCLHSLLAQTYPREMLEIVVSDDGSRDGTRELMERMQARHGHLKYVYQPHRGIAAARNNGIVHANGAIVAIVADDYILDSTYASTIKQFFDHHLAAMVVRFKVVAAGWDLGSRTAGESGSRGRGGGRHDSRRRSRPTISWRPPAPRHFAVRCSRPSGRSTNRCGEPRIRI